MKTLYFNCFSGASGDMLVGSLIDLGVKLSAVEWELGKLELPDKFHLHANRDQRQNVTGIKFTVHDESQHQCCGHDHGSDHGHSHEHEHQHEEHSHSHPHEHVHGSEHSHDHEHAHEDADDGSEFIHEQGHAHSHEHGHTHTHGRNHEEIRKLITDSALSDFVKQRALAVFQRIAVVEGKIHGVAPEKVTFHEVGALDSIIDIISFCVGIEKLGRPRVLASPLVEGTGWVDCAHGRFPVPSTATLELLAGIPLTQVDEPHELLTPTGAALLAEFAEGFAPMQGLKTEKVGYGLGTRHLKSRPNVVRAILGEVVEAATTASEEQDMIVVLETNLDDLPGELIGDAQEKLFAAGALDVFYQPIQMKKNRPGVLLSVLASPADADKLADLILTHTSAFGVRRTTAERTKLRREIKTMTTPFGAVEVKLGYRGDTLVQIAPEFESARKIADAKNVPLQKVYDAARQAVS